MSQCINRPVNKLIYFLQPLQVLHLQAYCCILENE